MFFAALWVLLEAREEILKPAWRMGLIAAEYRKEKGRRACSPAFPFLLVFRLPCPLFLIDEVKPFLAGHFRKHASHGVIVKPREKRLRFDHVGYVLEVDPVALVVKQT